MSFTVITGAAGVGKTARLFEKIITSARIAPERTHIVLVPEQATLQTEGRLVAMHPEHILFNIEVLSFNRLAYRLFDYENTGIPAFLDESGKSMLIRKAAQNRRNGFSVYEKGIERTGVINHMKAAVSELMQYGVGPDRLAGLADGMGEDPVLAGKLRDLSAVYDEYLALKDADTMSAEEVQSRAAALLERSDYLRGAMIAIDGFTGFTPVQLSIIGQLMRRAIDCTLALTVPAGASTNDDDEFDLFSLTKKTLRKLIDTAAQNGMKTAFLPVVEIVPRARPADLAFLAEHFLKDEDKKAVFDGPAQNLVVADCGSPRDEAVFVADTIGRLVREEGYRYRDFTVVSADLEGNHTYLSRAFADAGIPAYIDIKKGIMEQPIAVFLISAVEIAEKNFPYDAMFRFLRTGLCGITANETDILENYAVGTGISGRRRWTQPFSKPYKNHNNIDFDRLNDVRKRAVVPVLNFCTALGKKKRSYLSACGALRDLLEELHIDQKLADLSVLYEERGDLLESRLYAQIFPHIEKLIGQVEAVLGPQQCGLKEFREILQAGLSQLAIGSVPPVIDEVQTGDLRRSRRGRARVLFLINAADRVLPRPVFEAGVFTDDQRRRLAQLGLELAPTARENCIYERFYMHELVNLPEDRLYVTCSRRDRTGNTVTPSAYIPLMTDLFPGFEPLRFEADRVRLPQSVREAKHLLAAAVRERGKAEDGGRMRQLYAAFSRDPENRDFLKKVLDAGFYVRPSKRLEASSLERLYPGDVDSSATRLERQAGCAYSAFLRFAMRLKEREVFELDPADIGSIDHSLIEAAMRHLIREAPDLQTVDEEMSRRITEAAFQEVREKYGEYISGSFRDRYYIERFRKVTEKNIRITAEQLAEGTFRPEAVELPFSGRMLQDLALPLSSGKKLILSGRIDRIDRSTDADGTVARVIDYKTGTAALDLNKVQGGLSLQLMIYLMALRELSAEGTLAGGAYYYQIKDPTVEAEGNVYDEQKIRAERRKKLQLTGLQCDDPRVMAADSGAKGEKLTRQQLDLLLDSVRRGIIRLGEDLTAGRIDVLPSRYRQEVPCTRCPFGSVCGFDPKLAGCGYRRIADRRTEEILEELDDSGRDGLDNGTESGG